MYLYSYVIKRDYGFAPNPFENICSLATCKPQIRERALEGIGLQDLEAQILKYIKKWFS